MRSLGFLSLCLALKPGAAADSSSRGRRFYYGEEPLAGRIRGSDETLPPEVLRCANCHDSASGKQLGVLAPQLNRTFLAEPRQRRGGPPSRYDAASFCKLLATGVDPAYILIAREMPVYELNETQCQSLWDFVVKEEKTK